MLGADNQQERLDANWVVGFVDGEGCFYVGINKMPKMTLGYQVIPEFRVVQHQRDENPLQTLKKYDFAIFSRIIAIMNKKQHLNHQGLRLIAKLASQMNKKIKRHLESSETIRQSSAKSKI